MNIFGVGVETTLVTIFIAYRIYQQLHMQMIARKSCDLSDELCSISYNGLERQLQKAQ